MPNKIKLIFNPIANLGRAWPVAAALRPIVYEAGGADWSGTVYPTHATELAYQAGKDGYDLVVAMGGDGTVHEVVNGLMKLPAEQRPRLGVVPVGSGNDFAHAIGVSKKPDEALRQALTGSPRRLDMGVVCDSQGRVEYWANTIGIGFDTIVTIHSRKVPVVQGFAVYFAAVLRTILFNYSPFRIQVKTDESCWNEEAMMLVLCNGMREGGGFYMDPKMRLDDGKLTYVEVQKISVARMLMTIPYFMKGTHEHLAYVRMGSFSKMELTSDQPMFVHTDGEILAGFASKTNYLSIQVLPGALEVMA